MKHSEALRGYELNNRWLSDPENKRKYQGEWVVLCRGKLLAHGHNYTGLYRKYGNLLNSDNQIVRVY